MPTVKLTKREIEHRDPDAAGFTTGWWWSIDVENAGHVESGAPTRDAALQAAAAAADVPVSDLKVSR
jgi:hypothetical protein